MLFLFSTTLHQPAVAKTLLFVTELFQRLQKFVAKCSFFDGKSHSSTNTCIILKHELSTVATLILPIGGIWQVELEKYGTGGHNRLRR